MRSFLESGAPSHGFYTKSFSEKWFAPEIRARLRFRCVSDSGTPQNRNHTVKHFPNYLIRESYEKCIRKLNQTIFRKITGHTLLKPQESLEILTFHFPKSRKTKVHSHTNNTFHHSRLPENPQFSGFSRERPAKTENSNIRRIARA